MKAAPLRASANAPSLSEESEGAQKVACEGQAGGESERDEVSVRRREYETEVSSFLKEASARAQVEPDAADDAQRLELRAVEHPRRDLPRQAGHGCVRQRQPRQPFRQRRAQKPGREAQAEEQHPLDVRVPRETEGE